MSGHPIIEPCEPRRAADCWTTIGVHGDGSCPELKHHVHCRNCPVYAEGARRLLDGDAPAGDIARWTRHFAEPKPIEERHTESVLVFRVGSEWLALASPCVAEVAALLPIHTLPHRPKGVVQGVASVRGELLICVSLGCLLGIESPAGVDRTAHRASHPRVLVIHREHLRLVCPVDEVHGIHRFHPRELMDVPSTVAGAASTYSRALLSWRDRSIGVLDDERLFHALRRSAA
jgi:chemotaxis-related protein WspD